MNPSKNIQIAAYGLLRPNSEADGTVYGYNMWNTGGFPVAMTDPTHRIHGKGQLTDSPIKVALLKVDRDTLNRFDHVEQEGIMYKRILETVYLNDGDVTSAWFYQGVNDFWSRRLLQPKIKDGDWRKFQKKRFDRLKGNINMNIFD